MMTVPEMLEKSDRECEETISVIFENYEMNDTERIAYPHFNRIVELFQYPNVCSMKKWLGEEKRREKCAALICALINKPL